ncbi:MAG: hypothetical protein HGA85_03005, partial [Nanoarchaeota archaeon]|nr:hypothetical protein [Nanoarchaeota archaeon]
LLMNISESLASRKNISPYPNNIPFVQNVSYMSLTIYQAGQVPIKTIGIQQDMVSTVNYLTSLARQAEGFDRFEIANSEKSRILIEIVIAQEETSFEDIRVNGSFTPGITGVRIVNEVGVARNYLPTCSAYKNHDSFSDVVTYLSDDYAKQYAEKNVSFERKTRVYLTRSISYITSGEEAVRLNESLLALS